MANRLTTAEDRDFQAESDAHALIAANEIQGDEKRLKRAKKALDRIEKEAEKTKREVQVARKLKKL